MGRTSNSLSIHRARYRSTAYCNLSCITSILPSLLSALRLPLRPGSGIGIPGSASRKLKLSFLGDGARSRSTHNRCVGSCVKRKHRFLLGRRHTKSHMLTSWLTCESHLAQLDTVVSPLTHARCASRRRRVNRTWSSRVASPSRASRCHHHHHHVRLGSLQTPSASRHVRARGLTGRSGRRRASARRPACPRGTPAPQSP